MRFRRALSRGWHLILIAVICGAIGGWALFHTSTPQYKATTTLALSYVPSGTSAFDAVAQAQLAAQRAALLAQLVPASLDAARTEAGVGADLPAVTAYADGVQPFLTIAVIDTDPQRAADVANAFQKVLPKQLASVIGSGSKDGTLRQPLPAVPPRAPFAPSLKKDLGLGLIGGLAIGLAIALLREALDTTVRDADAMARIAGAAALGAVPFSKTHDPLPTLSDPRSVRAEAYRQIRTALLRVQPPAKVAVVTSAVSGEGKTTVTANVATACARAGLRVIVVDADLRRPMLASVFDVPASFEGLTEYLQGRISVHDAIIASHVGDTVAGDLPDIITAGAAPANPSELLGSPRFAALIAELRSQYDYIFIDTPPILPVTDALVVAPQADGVILVGSLEDSTPARLRRAIANLERVNVRLLGTVPNNARGGSSRDYRYDYNTADRRVASADGTD